MLRFRIFAFIILFFSGVTPAAEKALRILSSCHRGWGAADQTAGGSQELRNCPAKFFNGHVSSGVRAGWTAAVTGGGEPLRLCERHR
jgi:hypothetical protein